MTVGGMSNIGTSVGGSSSHHHHPSTSSGSSGITRFSQPELAAPHHGSLFHLVVDLEKKVKELFDKLPKFVAINRETMELCEKIMDDCCPVKIASPHQHRHHSSHPGPSRTPIDESTTSARIPTLPSFSASLASHPYSAAAAATTSTPRRSSPLPPATTAAGYATYLDQCWLSAATLQVQEQLPSTCVPLVERMQSMWRDEEVLKHIGTIEVLHPMRMMNVKNVVPFDDTQLYHCARRDLEHATGNFANVLLCFLLALAHPWVCHHEAQSLFATTPCRSSRCSTPLYASESYTAFRSISSRSSSLSLTASEHHHSYHPTTGPLAVKKKDTELLSRTIRHLYNKLRTLSTMVTDILELFSRAMREMNDILQLSVVAGSRPHHPGAPPLPQSPSTPMTSPPSRTHSQGTWVLPQAPSGPPGNQSPPTLLTGFRHEKHRDDASLGIAVMPTAHGAAGSALIKKTKETHDALEAFHVTRLPLLLGQCKQLVVYPMQRLHTLDASGSSSSTSFFRRRATHSSSSASDHAHDLCSPKTAHSFSAVELQHTLLTPTLLTVGVDGNESRLNQSSSSQPHFHNSSSSSASHHLHYHPPQLSQHSGARSPMVSSVELMPSISGTDGNPLSRLQAEEVSPHRTPVDRRVADIIHQFEEIWGYQTLNSLGLALLTINQQQHPHYQHYPSAGSSSHLRPHPPPSGHPYGIHQPPSSSTLSL